MTSKGYELQDMEVEWLVEAFKNFVKGAGKHVDTADREDGFSIDYFVDEINLLRRLIQTRAVRTEDRAALVRRLLHDRYVLSHESPDYHAKFELIGDFLYRLSLVEWDAMDDRGEETYNLTELWRGFRRSEAEMNVLLQTENVHVVCREGYAGVETGATVTLTVIEDEEEDNPGHVYEIKLTRVRTCAESGDASPDTPNKMFEGAIISGNTKADWGNDWTEMFGFALASGKAVVFPASPHSEYSERMFHVGLLFLGIES